MTARSYSRGWPLVYRGEWVYEDTGEPVDDVRVCARCGRKPTPEGHDACLGHIEGVTSACCGHGVEDGFCVKEQERCAMCLWCLEYRRIGCAMR